MEFLWLIPLLPYLGACLLILMGSTVSRKLVPYIGAGSIGLSAVVTVMAGIDFLSSGQDYIQQTLWTWMNAGGLDIGLTLTLDYTHFTRDGRPDSEVEPLIPLASHFHARCARPRRLQSSFKENAIDYGRILDVMAEVGYPGFVGVEYVWIDWEHCNEVDNLSETILLRDHIRKHSRNR